MSFLRIALILIIGTCSARGADHFLIMGGGGSPQNEQISLEKNVQYVQKSFTEVGVPQDARDLLFGSGRRGTNEVKWVDGKAEIGRAEVLLAKLFGREEEMRTRFKPVELTHVRSGLNRAGITDWFSKVGAKLGDGDRLIIYYTGHGGAGQRNQSHNTTLILYGENPMFMKDFAGFLDKLSPKVEVILIMAQCHAGGFADVIFQNATPGPEMSSARRCGFFATTPERVAAGCTPDIEEENYKEYSTYFWAAVFGKTRLGDPAEPSDFDGDGKVSMSEAHAYVKIHSDNIDIPISTSDVFLRQYSRNNGPPLMPTFSTALKMATPVQKAVLEGLCKELKLDGEDRFQGLRVSIGELQRDRRNTEMFKGKLTGELNGIRERIRSRLRSKWPLVGAKWDPRLVEVAKTDGAEMVKIIESDQNFPRFQELEKQIDALTSRSMEFERRAVKFERLLQEIDVLQLADQLLRNGGDVAKKKYAQLLGQESQVLFEGKKNPGEAGR